MMFLIRLLLWAAGFFCLDYSQKLLKKDKNILLNCIDKTIKKMYIENIRGVAPVFILIGG